jgi:hypothetical protein
MKKFKNCNQKALIQALEIALNLNFYGKRLMSKKVEVAEQIHEDLELSDNIGISTIVDYLEENRPVKQEKAKKELEPLIPTFAGNTQQRDESVQILPAGRYIISSAQNNTTPHASFEALKQLAVHLKATLLLMPIKYTTTLESRERKTPTFNHVFDDYMLHDDAFIGGRSGVRLAVSACVLPTAKQPINTAKNMNTGEALTIVASPKQQMMTLPRPKGAKHRWLYTSRAVTTRHYTDSRAGGEAEQDHVFGGIYIEVMEDGTIKHQELQAEENSGNVFAPMLNESINLGVVVEAMVLGDLHCEKMCADSLNRALDEIEQYNPKEVILHDTLDFMSRNHHNRNSGRFLYQMGQRTVIDDLRETIAIINRIAEDANSSVESVFIVCSNHDLALDLWLDCPHYKADQDILNAKTYYFLKHAILEHIDLGSDDLNVFDLACRKLADQVGELSSKVTFGVLDEQHVINGFEVGQHGHCGSGGARGSARTFKGYQMPIITGHTHAPQRNGAQLTVGVTGSLEMGYNKGGSAWDRANALILSNGISLLAPTYRINEIQY